jgi:hypothetical protein
MWVAPQFAFAGAAVASTYQLSRLHTVYFIDAHDPIHCFEVAGDHFRIHSLFSTLIASRTHSRPWPGQL